MQDRVPTPGQEGRVLITPENGGTPFYATVTMADNPSVVGTPLNKATFLKDSTATAFGLSTDAVPDEVFQILAQAALYKIVGPTAQIGTLPVGTTVDLNENGVPVPYIIVNQGIPQNSILYDSSCNGTWVLRRDIYENAVWDAGNSNLLPGADIFTTMAGMMSLYDANVQSAIKTVKIPYCVGGGSSSVQSGANGLECQIFLLGGYEIGWTNSTDPYIPVDGAVLTYFQGTSATDSKRIAYFNGNASTWWLRSAYTNSANYSWTVGTNGYCLGDDASDSFGVRPAFILPSDFTVYTSEPTTGLYDVSDNLLLKLPGAQIETGSYVGTGTYGEDNPSSLTFGFEPKFVVVVETGVQTIYGKNGFIWLYNSSGAFSFTTSNSSYGCTTSLSSNIFYWYGSNANNQLNVSDTTYNYVALG